MRGAATALLAAGCATGGSHDTAPATRSPSTTAPTAADSSPGATSWTDPDGEEDAVITFDVEGGFAAQVRSLRLDSQGTAVAEVSGRAMTGRIAREDVAAIVAELEASGLFREGARHTYPPPGGADVQRYEIGYGGASVVAHDTTVPPELTTAVRLLQAALLAVQKG